jgi:hypothetical protein
MVENFMGENNIKGKDSTNKMTFSKAGEESGIQLNIKMTKKLLE